MRTTKPHFITSLLLIIVFNGIILSKSAYANGNAPLTATLNKYDPLCKDDHTGLIDLEVKGGVLPYSFKWNNGASSEDLSGLSSGVYTVQVKDAAGNVLYASAEIQQPAAIKIDAVVAESNFAKNDGRIQLRVTGGKGGYDYLWSDNSERSFISNLEEGIYAVKVSDRNQCFQTALFRVKEILKMNVKADIYNLLCSNDETGAIDITIKGGKEPYTFLWSNGAVTEDITGLSEGKYSVKISDADDQVIEKHFDVKQPEQLAVMATVTDETFKNAANGNALIEIRGGTKPFNIEWESGSNKPVAENLISGTYSVIVTDAHQCKMEHEVLISTTSMASLDRQAILPSATNEIRILPNPASDFVTVSSVNQKMISVKLYDLDGREVKCMNSFSNSVTLNLKDMPAGLYTMFIVKESGMEVQKIAKAN